MKLYPPPTFSVAHIQKVVRARNVCRGADGSHVISCFSASGDPPKPQPPNRDVHEKKRACEMTYFALVVIYNTHLVNMYKKRV